MTFWESEPCYGEKTDLNSLFELGDPSMGVDDREGVDDMDILQ